MALVITFVVTVFRSPKNLYIVMFNLYKHICSTRYQTTNKGYKNSNIRMHQTIYRTQNSAIRISLRFKTWISEL